MAFLSFLADQTLSKRTANEAPAEFVFPALYNRFSSFVRTLGREIDQQTSEKHFELVKQAFWELPNTGKSLFCNDIMNPVHTNPLWQISLRDSNIDQKRQAHMYHV